MVPMLGLCATQWFGIDGRRTFVAFQAMTPYVLFCAAPVALAACLGRRHSLAITAIVPLTTLMVLSFPIVFHADPPAVAENSPRFSIATSNMLFVNPTPSAAAARLIATDADVLVFIEVTRPLHDALVAVLAESGHDDYPYRVGTNTLGSESIELWSRRPIVSGGLVELGDRPAIDVMLDIDGTEVRVVAVHPYPPTFNALGWQSQLQTIGDAAAGTGTPTLLIGDFNGSRWHPSFRRLLERGWQDTHETLGHGWSVSWPMDEGWFPPQFVRIDHALFRNGLTPTGMDDFEVPGSDHKGYRVDFGFTADATR